MFLLKLLEGPKIKVKTTHKTVDRSKNVDRSKTKVKGKKNAVKDVEDIDIAEEPKKKKKKFRLFGKKNFRKIKLFVVISNSIRFE